MLNLAIMFENTKTINGMYFNNKIVEKSKLENFVKNDFSKQKIVNLASVQNEGDCTVL